MTDELNQENLAAAKKLFAGECTFMLGVVKVATLPSADTPEIAFAGRSNVGKSSLINALTGRNALARTSNTPGRTRELNFFDLGGTLRLVDLPGYGYAKASRTDVDSWTGLTRDYLRGRPNLRRVMVLVDSRHGLKPVDEETMSLLDESAVTYQIVLTKIDKLSLEACNKVEEGVAAAIAKHPAAFPVIARTSSAKNYGIDELRTGIFEAATV